MYYLNYMLYKLCKIVFKVNTHLFYRFTNKAYGCLFNKGKLHYYDRSECERVLGLWRQSGKRVRNTLGDN